VIGRDRDPAQFVELTIGDGHSGAREDADAVYSGSGWAEGQAPDGHVVSLDIQDVRGGARIDDARSVSRIQRAYDDR
jgi:hypothetical protein